MPQSATRSPPRLYVTEESVTVSRHVEGVPQGTTTLTTQYEADLRSGKHTLVRDPNGREHTTLFDSFGRALEERGPGGELLAKHDYDDLGLHLEVSTVYTSASESHERTRWRTPDGRLLAETLSLSEGRPLPSADVPASWLRKTAAAYDAFGRAMRIYPPRYGSDDPLALADDASELVEHDGFGRETYRQHLDGTATSTRRRRERPPEVRLRFGSETALHDFTGETTRGASLLAPPGKGGPHRLTSVYNSTTLGICPSASKIPKQIASRGPWPRRPARA